MFRFYAREKKSMLMTMVGKDVREQTTLNIKLEIACPTPIDEAIAITLTSITPKWTIIRILWGEGE